MIEGRNNPHVLNFEIMLSLFTEYLPAERNEGIASRDQRYTFEQR